MNEGSFYLLTNSGQWETYKNNLVSQNTVLQASAVQWGAGPQAYPCMVASFVASAQKVVCCYVYPEQARELLGVAVATLIDGEEEKLSKLEGPELDPVSAAQGLFNRNTAAHILTLIKLLVDTSIVKQPQYEQMFTANLATVDQWEANTRTEMTDVAKSTLKTIFPDQ